MRKIILLIVAIATLGSCQKEETTTDNWNGEIRLSSNIAVVKTRSANGGAPDTQIANGQKIGLFIFEKDPAAAPYVATRYDNLQYNADGKGGLTLEAGSTQPYYPQSGKSVNIVAYHPFMGSMEYETFFDRIVATDQSANEKYYASDFLYSEMKEYARSKTTHTISFKHKLSKIICKLTSGDGNPDIDGATVEVMNVYPEFKFYMNNRRNMLSPLEKNPVNIKLNNQITQGSYIGIVPPQLFKKNKFLKVTLKNGGKLYYELGDNLEVKSGFVYTYNITVNLTSLSVGSTIADWETGASIDGTATN